MAKARNLYGETAHICGRHKRESGCAIPGEVCQPVTNYRDREVTGRAGRSQQRA